MKRVSVSFEDLVNHWHEDREGGHRSEIIEARHYAADGMVEISIIDREFVLEVISYIDAYMTGPRAKYLKDLVQVDLESSYPEEKKDYSDESGDIIDQTTEQKFDSPTYGDLQSPAAEKLRPRTPAEHGNSFDGDID